MLPVVSTLSALQGLPTAVAACGRGISTSVAAAAHWWRSVEQVGCVQSFTSPAASLAQLLQKHSNWQAAMSFSLGRL